MRTIHLIPVALLVASAGCEAASSPSFEASARDSAGVRIVESPAPGPAEGWEVEVDPMVTIGVMDGEAAYAFSIIRGALRLGDGTIVVADGSTAELRFFDADGVHRATAGGRGDGPGEFQSLSGMFFGPDGSIVTTDAIAGRVTSFDATGTVEETWTPGAVEERFPPMPKAAMTGGRYLGWTESFPEDWEEGFNHHELEQRVHLFEDSATPSRQILSAAGRDASFHSDGRGVSNLYVPFAKDGRVAARGARIYQGNGEAWEIRGFDPDGNLQEILRLGQEPRAVTPEMIRTDREALYARLPNEERRQRSREQQEQIPVPDRMPAYGDFRVDSKGFLWVETFRPNWEDGERAWILFDGEGVAVARVEVPRALAVQPDRERLHSRGHNGRPRGGAGPDAPAEPAVGGGYRRESMRTSSRFTADAVAPLPPLP